MILGSVTPSIAQQKKTQTKRTATKKWFCVNLGDNLLLSYLTKNLTISTIVNKIKLQIFAVLHIFVRELKWFFCNLVE